MAIGFQLSMNLLMGDLKYIPLGVEKRKIQYLNNLTKEEKKVLLNLNKDSQIVIG